MKTFTELRKEAHQQCKTIEAEVKSEIEKMLKEQIFEKDSENLKKEVLVAMCRLDKIVAEISIDTEKDPFRVYCDMSGGRNFDSLLAFEINQAAGRVVPESQSEIKTLEIKGHVHYYRVTIFAR